MTEKEDKPGKQKTLYEKWDADAASGQFMKGYAPGKFPGGKKPAEDGRVPRRKNLASGIKRVFGKK